MTMERKTWTLTKQMMKMTKQSENMIPKKMEHELVVIA